MDEDHRNLAEVIWPPFGSRCWQALLADAEALKSARLNSHETRMQLTPGSGVDVIG